MSRERPKAQALQMSIEILKGLFSVCKLEDYSEVNWNQTYIFLGKTDKENSLVCLTECVPEKVLEREDGWKGVRIAGQLEFSLIGILAHITKVLADYEIGVFVVSTFDTDYVFIKEKNYERALSALRGAGYSMEYEGGANREEGIR